MKVALVFPHQLYRTTDHLEGVDAVYLLEDSLYFGTDAEWGVRFHAQKLILHRSSMSSYMTKLERAKINCHRIEIGKHKHTRELLGKLPSDTEEIQVVDVVDDVLMCRLESFCKERGIKLVVLDSPNFLTPKPWAEQFFSSGKKPFMAAFYEAQRKRMDIMVTDGKPTGGKWSFDEENRKKLPKKVELPPAVGCSENECVREARDYLEHIGVKSLGCADDFIYPVDHAAAEKWLDRFLYERFYHFGTYEDALSARDPFLFHSVLTPMLNIGLLDPERVVSRALTLAKELQIEMNNLEGFIRQIIGWREFMKIMYERHGRYLRTKNFFGFEDEMPLSIYRGKTGILPVDITLDRVHRYAYSHHIERLMVMGNFFVLMRVKPESVYRWFMEMYIDAYDWVMVPNVYGMSQFSDGGLLVTKPYVSGSNYLCKMSDYPKGDWCDAWDSLFWVFVSDHRDFFASQYRMKMMLSHLNKMSVDKLEEHHARAENVRDVLAAGGVWKA